MRLLFIGIIIILWIKPHTTVAQNMAVDSLEMMLQSDQLSVSTRITLLNQLAQELSFGYTGRAGEYARESLQLAMVAQDEQAIAEAEYTIARVHVMSGQFELALREYLKCLQRFRQLGEQKMETRTLYQIAKLQIALFDYDNAISYAHDAWQLVQSQHDPILKADIQLTYGQALLKEERYAEARLQLDSALQFYSAEQHAQKQAALYNFLAGVDIGQKRYESARIRLGIALEKAGDFCPIERTGVLLNKGILLLKTKDYSLAEQSLLQSRSLYEQYQLQQFYPELIPTLVTVYDSMRKPEKALPLMQQALQEERSRGQASRSEVLERLHLEFQTLQLDHEKAFLLQEAALRDQELQLTQWLLLTASMVIILLLVIATMMYVNAKHRGRSNDRLVQLNEEIAMQRNLLKEQATELQQANSEVREINENLEEIVIERSTQVLEQNKKLRDYAYFNSHRVRAPLARVLGLADLWTADLSDNERKIVLLEIEKSIKELDAVVQQINQILRLEREY